MGTFERSRKDGWTVRYTIDEHATRLLEVKGLVAHAVDNSTDYGNLLARLVNEAALASVRMRTESIDEENKLISVVFEADAS